MMIVAVVSLWSLVEVHSQQTFPYVCFMNQTLANHSYVDLSLVGDDGVATRMMVVVVESLFSVTLT